MRVQMSVILPAPSAFSYPIILGQKLLSDITPWLPSNKQNKMVIITDHNVRKHYASSLKDSLQKKGYTVSLFSFSPGEPSKNKVTKSELEEKMLKHDFNRDTVILAVGGGVVGDLAGFIAATYMRGVTYVQIPTTLLAMVDSSIGGKTGINTVQGKNLIGAFWQPCAVIADVDCLKTLPKMQLINGLVEALKMFLTSNVANLSSLERNLDLILQYEEETLIELIQSAVKIKVAIVCRDEKERERRSILNFGHTIGHALELVSHYKLLHGYAVALGLLVEAKIAELMGLLTLSAYQYIKNILTRLGIVGANLKKFDVKDVIKMTKTDKKKQHGIVKYVLLQELGKAYEVDGNFIHAVPASLVSKAFYEAMKE